MSIQCKSVNILSIRLLLALFSLVGIQKNFNFKQEITLHLFEFFSTKINTPIDCEYVILFLLTEINVLV